MPEIRLGTNEVFNPPKYRCSMLMILDLNVDDMSRCLLLETHLNIGDMLNVDREPTLRAPNRRQKGANSA